MYLKVTLLTGVFVALSVGSYYSAMSPLKETSLDDDFYQDLSLLSRFDEKSVGYRASIEADGMNVRNYLFNNSFNLIWKKKDSNEKQDSITGNAFLLNLLIPDWMDDYHPDRKNYTPRNLVAGDDVVMLLGTSFSFAKQLFDKVNDWSKEVNDVQHAKADDTSKKVLLSDKSNKSSTHQLLFSHPWPISTAKKPKPFQTHAYILGDSTYSSFGNDVQKPYYFDIESKNVEAIYAAVGLQLNQGLVNLNLSHQSRLLNRLDYVHNRQKDNSIKWQDSIKDVYGQTYKMALDFAVIKVKFNVAHLKHAFLDYLINAYKKIEVIPRAMDKYLEIKHDRTPAMFLGGWETMDEREVELHTMDNLYVKAKECKDSSTTVSLQVYDTYGASAKDKPTESTKYEATDIQTHANSAITANTKNGKTKPIYFIKYKIKHKSKGITSHKVRELVCVPDDAQDTEHEILRNWNKEKFLRDRKIVDFLESKPISHAHWREYGVRYSYFPFQNLQSDFWGKTITGRHLNQTTTPDGTDTTLDIFKVGSENYVNIAHHLDIPNLYLRNGKGMISIMQNPEKREKMMLGMYDGSKKWINPMSGQERYVGKVAMFISPWRYDILNADNHLSKPSLGDVLKKKKLNDRLIQTRRFRV